MLHALSKQRSIWLQAARKMCHSHGLFLPSFPFESMSSKELTRLALSPTIFSRLVSSGGAGRLLERRSWTFDPRVKNEDHLNLSCLHLLPGGRYLVAYHEEDVCMWDLGYGPAPPISSPLACLSIKGLQYEGCPPCPTKDGKGVTLAILSSGCAEDWANHLRN
jgi:hypothetical protein